jgi:hypothetical protein
MYWGKTIIDIDINGYVCSNVAIVADINVDGIILIHGHKVSLQFEGQIGCYKVATAKTIKMQTRRTTIVERKDKEERFLEKEQCPVYNEFKEKCSISCMQCNKNFKKAAYLRRHMKKCHANKTSSLEQVVVSPKQEKQEVE